MRKTALLVRVIAAGILAVNGCGKKASPTSPSGTSTTITGIVTDSLGNALPGAVVSVNYFYEEGTSHKWSPAKSCSLLWFGTGFGRGTITLLWHDTLETSTVRWDIHKSYKVSPLAYQVIASIPGTGTSNTMNSYTYRDSNGTNGNVLYYLLDEVDLTGAHVYHGPCIMYHQSVQTNAQGRYTFLNVPVDTLIPVYSSDGTCIRIDAVGTSFPMFAWKQGYVPYDTSSPYHSITKNVMNTINLTLH